MKKIFEFLREYNEVALATIGEDGKPAIRLFQIMYMNEMEKVIYFATAPHKEVYNQLLQNPAIEILSFANKVSVRMAGTAFFDVPDALCRQIYKDNLVLPRLYKCYTDLVYFRLVIEKAHFYDLKPTVPIQESYTF